MTRSLAAWIAGLRPNNIPSEMLAAARTWLLDTLGCGLYGTTTEWGRIALELTATSPGQATVFGSLVPSEPLHAALANGILVHAFEFDDYHPAGKIHTSAPVFPAALATAQACGSSGLALLVAYLIGVETAVRIAVAVHPDAARVRGWHITGICGVFGAAAASAWLRGLDAERTAWALGLAGSQAAGLWAFNADGAMSKRLHPGHAAQAGFLAAQLATLGFSGPVQILEAVDGGFLRAVSDDPRPALVLRDLGQTWMAESLALKPYPCCATVHSSLDAAIALYSDGLRAEHIRRVRVLQSAVGILQTGWPYAPSTALLAQMSLRYTVAAALTYGTFTVEQVTPACIADPALVDLASRIETVVDPEIDRVYPASRPSILEVELSDGSLLVQRVEEPRGSPSFPLSADDVRRKFRAQAAAVLSDDGIATVEDVVSNLEHYSTAELAEAIGGRRALAALR